MLRSLDDTIQLQSEALWERYRQRSVNANVALAAKVISATSHIQTQQLRDGYTAFAYKVAPSVRTFPHKFNLVGSQSVTSIRTSPSFSPSPFHSLCTLLVSHNKTEHAHCKPLGG